MAIQNYQIDTDQAINFPVCCTANLSLQTINIFLATVHAQEVSEKSMPILTLIHDLQSRYTGPTKKLRGDPTTILHSPFTNCSYPEIGRMLQQIAAETNSALYTDWFLVLDEQSERTETAVIVNVDDESKVRSVRVDYPTSSRYLSAASIAHPGFDELIEIAGETVDGVLRDN